MRVARSTVFLAAAALVAAASLIIGLCTGGSTPEGEGRSRVNPHTKAPTLAGPELLTSPTAPVASPEACAWFAELARRPAAEATADDIGTLLRLLSEDPPGRAPCLTPAWSLVLLLAYCRDVSSLEPPIQSMILARLATPKQDPFPEFEALLAKAAPDHADCLARALSSEGGFPASQLAMLLSQLAASVGGDPFFLPSPKLTAWARALVAAHGVHDQEWWASVWRALPDSQGAVLLRRAIAEALFEVSEPDIVAQLLRALATIEPVDRSAFASVGLAAVGCAMRGRVRREWLVGALPREQDFSWKRTILWGLDPTSALWPAAPAIMDPDVVRAVLSDSVAPVTTPAQSYYRSELVERLFGLLGPIQGAEAFHDYTRRGPHDSEALVQRVATALVFVADALDRVSTNPSLREPLASVEDSLREVVSARGTRIGAFVSLLLDSSLLGPRRVRDQLLRLLGEQASSLPPDTYGRLVR